MNSFLRFLGLFSLPARALNEQTALLKNAAQTIDLWQHQALFGYSAALDIALAARLHCEQPDVDIRDGLDATIRELQDQVARIEEIVV
jgi:hypothetical protein